MPKLRVHNLTVSLDGYAAGPEQGPDDPLGVRGPLLHNWVFETRTGRQMLGEEGGETGTDDDLLARGDAGIGTTDEPVEFVASPIVAHFRLLRTDSSGVAT